MKKTLFFYDLETSGFSPIDQRIMQFAGQRTDLNLNGIGEPVNVLIKLTDEILPDPEAILLTGITPQKTIEEGVSEVVFLKKFAAEIAIPDTIFTGFNNVRFDDEFMRYLLYRNFYDPYEWQWQNGRGKWDLLDVVRMTRALRPGALKWPSDNGVSSNRLELLTKANKIEHSGAHDALSDVVALIELAKLLKSKQPKIFNYLLDIMSDKNKIAKLVNDPNPFIYTSAKYPSEYEKTTVVAKLAGHPKRAGALVFDLRYDPNNFANLSIDQLIEAWRYKNDGSERLPIKTLQFNRCPALAPLGVLDESSQERLDLNLEQINKNYNSLNKIKDEFSKKILLALGRLDLEQEDKYAKSKRDVDGMLYDGFFDSVDKQSMQQVRELGQDTIASFDHRFKDSRLNSLLPLYKARNFKNVLSSEDIEFWDDFRRHRLLDGDSNSRLNQFLRKLEDLNSKSKLPSSGRFLLDELNLYAESIISLET